MLMGRLYLYPIYTIPRYALHHLISSFADGQPMLVAYDSLSTIRLNIDDIV
jgi:hypothetical protein